jgi:hypothetical protein
MPRAFIRRAVDARPRRREEGLRQACAGGVAGGR